MRNWMKRGKKFSYVISLLPRHMVVAGKVFSGLSICFPCNISKTTKGRITKLDIEMFHHESWKPVYFVVKGQGHEAHKTAPESILALFIQVEY